jgi:hypothetical protein
VLSKVISGGQTGADRGGLDAAIELGVEQGGWCTWKRRAEDGCIPKKYKMEELALLSYGHRTLRNVMESDATVIFMFGPDPPVGPKGPSGSEVTRRMAKKHLKALCVVDLEELGIDGAADLVTDWLETCESMGRDIEILNVAGARESRSPGIQKAVKKVMLKVLERCK